LVEVEPYVREFIAILLRQAGHCVLAARNASEAVSMFSANRHVDLLLSDVELGPGMNGIDLAFLLRRVCPRLKVLLMSGVPNMEARATQQGFPFLAKPFSLQGFSQRLAQSLAEPTKSSGERSRTDQAKAASC
jgi:DNA-binding NtrC family response regulator